MPAPALAVPELWDSIIDCLTSSQDYSSTALVCRSFVSRAQKNLFREVVIEKRSPAATTYNYGSHNSSISSTVVATRLSALLDESPHLLSYIQTLEIAESDSECYAILARIPWSHLENLILCSLAGLWDSCFEHIKVLAGINSLCELNLSRRADPWSIRQILPVSQHLTSLRLSQQFWTGSQDPGTAALSTSQRPHIERLSLDECKDVTVFLCQVFDFEGLRSLEVMDSLTPDMPHFLSRYGSTVDHITLSPLERDRYENTDHWDLGLYFPHLTTIKFLSLPDMSFIRFIAGLPLDNRVSYIGFSDDASPLMRRKGVSATNAKAFEAIAVAQLPLLKVVEVQITASRYIAWSPETLENSIRELFPRLRERQLVTIRVFYFDFGED
ncbi:hypothetical protein R3P38DRAFT_3495992 [Favolaschia claudopus]|uniref:F-box domain-containing protein n=1 Tax=Favolaschia claudopus TaxID=2862362 RepID=A0AAV9Z5M6_9AGAR